MSSADVVEHFDRYWIHLPGTSDGCQLIAVEKLDAPTLRALLAEYGPGEETCLSFSPNSPEECTADVCFAFFQEDRLTRVWLSPD